MARWVGALDLNFLSKCNLKEQTSERDVYPMTCWKVIFLLMEEINKFPQTFFVNLLIPYWKTWYHIDDHFRHEEFCRCKIADPITPHQFTQKSFQQLSMPHLCGSLSRWMTFKAGMLWAAMDIRINANIAQTCAIKCWNLQALKNAIRTVIIC